MEQEIGAPGRKACLVVYRGTLKDGGEAEVRLLMPGGDATMADAWSRLSARFGVVDPLSIEIEIRQRPARSGQVGAPPASRRGGLSWVRAAY